MPTIPVEPLLRNLFAIYLGPGAPPDARSLRAHVEQELGSLAEPIGGIARMLIARPELLTVDVQPARALPAPPLEMMRYLGTGEDEIARIARASHAAIVAVTLPILPGFPGSALALAGSRAVASLHDGVILDVDRRRALPSSDVDRPVDAQPRFVATRDLILPVSRGDDGLGWMTTLGMPSYGLPNLSMRAITPGTERPVLQLVNAVAQAIVESLEREAIDKRGKLERVTLGETITIDHGHLARARGQSAPNDRGRGASIGLRLAPAGQHEPFLELVAPPGVRDDVWASRALDALLGAPKTMGGAYDADAMEAAHREAVATLPRARERFSAGLDVHEALYVKHGFDDRKGGREYMWIAVTSWRGDRIEGRLANHSTNRIDLRAGVSVSIAEGDVYDWMLAGAGGVIEGGFTSKVSGA
ncbi:DUF2314 domain-containing protein [Sandaracinus amylolyticus]|uniref:DUF2314 domain-containing protein n=1 Tax=Sandaracinus amylolyticus TaxID=927083 RepID=A0A0F6YKU2_9BACT|nr:DUF2314 domain-containing protein [Sandaracinus amylolyticus]AKF08557.1 hypothetical protein DB32_005706 [Sandaracinus amylolyticus]